MIKVQLADLVSAEIHHTDVLQASSRWLFKHTLIVGPYRSGNEHETHIAHTVGSFDYFTRSADEMRFGKTELFLESIWFRVPTKNISEHLNQSDGFLFYLRKVYCVFVHRKISIWSL